MRRHPIFEQMRNDHQRVLERMTALETAVLGDAGRRGHREKRDALLRDAVGLLEAQFGTHMAAEDEVLFPALAEALPETRPSLVPLGADHAELRSMVRRLAATLDEVPGSLREQEIGVQVRDLVDLLRIHIRKEEAIVLSVAERVLKPREIEVLAARVNRRTLEGPPSGSASGRTKGVR